ncbi:DMT family transporter [Thiomicrorhabdus indica]|uniref:DMT family transporter n=1 Tax=Thiomicrorhabdus indica TaxID=2267253 RepID=UPI00102DEDD1|nr:DMT family transporter [Thiomicrorhabdus indica]
MSVIEAQRQRQGESFAAGMVFLESWFPIAAAISVVALGGLHAYFYSLLFAVVALAFWWVSRRKFSDLKNRKAYFPLAMTSLFITSLFALTFVALQYTSAINVAIILFLQILFSYVFLGRKPGERLQVKQILGAALMTLGALLVLFPGKIDLRLGDFLVLLAAMIAPIANLYQKRAREYVSSPTVLLVRSLLALPVIYVLAWLLEDSPSFEMIQQQLPSLLFVGIMIFFLSKVLWIEAIYRLPITKVNALFAFSPLLTMLWSWWLLDQAPHWFQVLGALPIVIGAYWVSGANFNSVKRGAKR